MKPFVFILLFCISQMAISQKIVNCGHDTVRFNLLNNHINQYLTKTVRGYKAEKWCNPIINPITGDLGLCLNFKSLKGVSESEKQNIINHTLDWIKSDNEYLSGEYFLTNWIHKSKLEIPEAGIIPTEIKGLLYMIPYEIYLQNKSLIESRIDLYKCVIRKVKKNELIKSE